MPDETPIAGVMPVTAPVTVPAGEAVKPPETEGEKPQPQSLEAALAELAEMKAQIKRVNAESAERRRKLAAYEDAEKQRQQAELGELEKLRIQAAEKDDLYQEAVNKLVHYRIEPHIIKLADKMGFQYPDLVPKQMSWDGVTMDDQEQVQGVEEALKALLKTYPNLGGRQERAAPDLNAQQRSSGPQDLKAREAELRKRFRIGA